MFIARPEESPYFSSAIPADHSILCSILGLAEIVNLSNQAVVCAFSTNAESNVQVAPTLPRPGPALRPGLRGAWNFRNRETSIPIRNVAGDNPWISNTYWRHEAHSRQTPRFRASNLSVPSRRDWPVPEMIAVRQSLRLSVLSLDLAHW